MLGLILSILAASQTFVGDISKNLISLLSKLGIYKKHSEGVALSDFSKNSRVRPLTVISNDLLGLKELDGILLNILNIFTAYYIQAFTISKIQINGVSVDKIIGRINTDYNPSFESLHTDYSLGLPGTIAKESIDVATSGNPVNKGQEVNDTFKVDPNLSVGKLINLTLGFPSYKNEGSVTTSNGEEIKQTRETNYDVVIPVLIQLSSVTVSPEIIADMFAGETSGRTLSERWAMYRSGQISFIKDLILCNDLIDEEKKLLMRDDSDTYLNILKRVNKSAALALVSGGKISFAAASNIYILSEETVKEIEYKLGGKIKDNRIREKLFTNNYAMIIVVIDREWERATFYYRDSEKGTDVSFSSLMKSNNKNMDIYEMFKMFNSGGSPIF